MGRSRALNPPYGAVNCIGRAELEEGGQEESKWRRKNACEMIWTLARSLWVNGCEQDWEVCV